MYKKLTDRQETKIRKMFRDVTQNFSLSENKNYDLTDEKLSYYRGMVISIISGIMGYTGCNWNVAMLMLGALLPLNHISLNLILPESWQEFTDEYGRLDYSKLTK